MHVLRYLVFLLFITSYTLSASVDFTKDEIEWIKNNPTVKLGADYKWPPFEFMDAKGKHSGLASEYIKLISKKSGLKFDVTSGVWSDVLEDMKEKKYDGLACAVETEERKRYLNFSTPYLTVPMVIVTASKNEEIKTVNDLSGKSVSINKGSYIHEWLESTHPEIKLHLTTSNEASLEAVSMGKADAYVGNLAVATYIMNKYLLNNLKIVTKLNEFTTSVSIAIDKDNTVLFNIIQKSLNSISPQEHQVIKKIWNKNNSTKNLLLEFTKEEQKWIKEHNEVRFVIDNNWQPIEYLSKDGTKHKGITSSYLDLVSKKTGIKFNRVPTDNWKEGVEKIESREADFFVCVSKTDSREKVVDFSTPYMDMPQVFVTSSEVSFIRDMKELYGKKLVLVKGYSITEAVKKEHPQIEIIEVENIAEALKILTEDKAYAYIETLPIASYYIQKNGFSNLKISGMSGYEYEFSMALRNDWGNEGIEIINKALSSISEEEKNDIYNNWMHVKFDKGVDYTVVWEVAAVFMLLILASLFYNRKLAVEIEKRKLAQAELIELNKKLEEATESAISANKAKSDFLSNMSHEIRTPMNAILGFAELLDEKIEDKKLKSFIKTIRSSGQTLLYLINDILDLSKIESGKLEIIKSMVNVKKLLQESVDVFELQAEIKGLKLYLEIDENMPTALLLDATRVKEILINLIGNALKFTDKGYIKVVVTVDEVYDHTSKVDITIKVEDSGIGIAKNNQDKIFNTFEQQENQDVKKYGGTGLGLSISKKLANLMNGSLEVKSEVDAGSTFTLRLKNIDIASLNSEEDQDESDLDYSDIKFEHAVVLVTDDVKENRDLVVESFLGTNIEVIEAVNGQEAIEKVKGENIDLILMDIRMPVMDGYSATRLIKDISKIPVIALTASIMQEDLKKLEGGRFNGYLRKPVSKNELYKEVSKYIRHNHISQKESVKNEIKVDNIEMLEEFLELTEREIDQLRKNAIKTNDLEIITNFSKALLEAATKYKVDYMINYSQLLLDKIDTFEIDSITLMLNDYEHRLEELRSIVSLKKG